ncbi:MAG: C40 family peptidase [Proteobacteria bacterium]|nr:C40 family peptidase [Pseudomonadota bacterium]
MSISLMSGCVTQQAVAPGPDPPLLLPASDWTPAVKAAGRGSRYYPPFPLVFPPTTGPAILDEEGFGPGRDSDSDELSPVQTVLATAYSQMGKAYRYGGTKPDTGFDCAGFVQWVFNCHDMKLPRTTGSQMKTGSRVQKEELQAGDLVFYWRGRGRRAHHVGIYIGDGKFIHSPRTGDRIKISHAFDSYHKARFIQARRLIDDPNAAPLPETLAERIVHQAAAARAAKAGTATARAAVSPEPATRAYRTYKIQQGDSLWTLARKFKVPVKDLRQANGLGKKAVLRVGRQLTIPGRPLSGKGSASVEARRSGQYSVGMF